MERHCKASTHLNAQLSMLVEGKDSFKGSAPLLFRRGFDQKAKDHIDAIKCLKKIVTPASWPFQRSHPHSPGEVACPGAGGQRNSAGQKELNFTCMCCSSKFIKSFNRMNCHCVNEFQSKTPTTEIVTNTKVSNPTINRVKRIQHGLEKTQACNVLEITQIKPLQEAAAGHQIAVLCLPILHLTCTQTDPPWMLLMK